VDDLASACLLLLETGDPPDWVNIGGGEETSILDLARLVAETVGYEGRIETDPGKPDGTPRKLLDSSVIRGLGWKPCVTLRAGLAGTYESFLREKELACLRG
jgi:GDP-L-fucose synthase